MFDSENSETISNYAPSPLAATLLSSKNQMARMYPTVELDKHPDAIMPMILDRTVHHMVHLDQKFDMNATFDQDHFDKMKSEAFVYLAWLESPEGTPFPASLRYSSSIMSEGMEQDEAVIIAPKDTALVQDESPKIRAISKNSKFQQALAIYNEDQVKHANRASTLQRMIAELDMNPNTANVYYSKFKNPAPVAK